MRYRFLRFPEGRAKAFTLSYDDGTVHDRQMLEVLNRYGIKCTINLNSVRLENAGEQGGITAQEFERLVYPHGHEIAVHGANHIAPGKASLTDTLREVLDGRRDLERYFGRIIRGMAYPDSGIRYIGRNTSYKEIRDILKAAGIVYARTLGGDNNSFDLPQDWYSWMPTVHHINPRRAEYLDRFLQTDVAKAGSASRMPMLFYLWGHSYEFDRDNSWDILEELCRTVGGREDIWYATNMQIYEYVRAYESLIFSVDNTIIINPSLVTVWFEADGELYSLKSGERLEISV